MKKFRIRNRQIPLTVDGVTVLVTPLLEIEGLGVEYYKEQIRKDLSTERKGGIGGNIEYKGERKLSPLVSEEFYPVAQLLKNGHVADWIKDTHETCDIVVETNTEKYAHKNNPVDIECIPLRDAIEKLDMTIVESSSYGNGYRPMRINLTSPSPENLQFLVIQSSKWGWVCQMHVLMAGGRMFGVTMISRSMGMEVYTESLTIAAGIEDMLEDEEYREEFHRGRGYWELMRIGLLKVGVIYFQALYKEKFFKVFRKDENTLSLLIPPMQGDPAYLLKVPREDPDLMVNAYYENVEKTPTVVELLPDVMSGSLKDWVNNLKEVNS